MHNPIVTTCELQMLMNVLVVLIPVMTIQLATTFKEVIPALATMDTQAMGSPAQVSYFEALYCEDDDSQIVCGSQQCVHVDCRHDCNVCSLYAHECAWKSRFAPEQTSTSVQWP